MDNTAKPTGSVNNSTRVDNAELWSTITTTWASETRTWAECISLMDNLAKTVYGDPLWTAQLIWQLNLPWQRNTSIMNNTEKP